MRARLGLVVMIAVGFVFLLGSSLALVELGTSRTVCSSRGGTFGRFRAACTTTGGTSPVVYVILVVAIVIGLICLAAGITVLAVRISGPAVPPPPASVASPSPYVGGGYPVSPAGASPAGASPAAGPLAGGTGGTGGTQAWWDGTRWVTTGSPPPG